MPHRFSGSWRTTNLGSTPAQLLVHASYLIHERPPPLVCLAAAAAATMMPLSLANACSRSRGTSHGIIQHVRPPAYACVRTRARACGVLASRHVEASTHTARAAAAAAAAAVRVWCRDSTGWFLPAMSQKRHMLPLFSGLTLFLAFAFHWRSWRGPRLAWLCGSFFGWPKPGSQPLPHRK